MDVKCSRCGNVECICGDPAFEAWVEEELKSQQDADSEPDQQTLDVTVRNEGTVFAFTPLTPAAKSWFDENVQSEGWQWLGNTLCVEHRYACDLIDGIRDAGLEVR